MPLHIDHRPKTLDQIVGNKATVGSLESILERKDVIKLPHAFLFHGASGCGKTTFARIIADRLECRKENYMEINAGNNRGIDTARSILNTLHYRPLGGGVRVILLDEVHATTKDFQNALLKSLEDTPPYVFFILCTTDPKKLLPTVRNRCITFEVKKLTITLLIKLITEILIEEGKDDEVQDEIVHSIAKRAEGCPRQALVLLDQVIDLKPKEREGAIQSFKTEEENGLELCRNLLTKGRWGTIAKILKGLDAEPESIRQYVLGYMTSTLLNSEKGNTQASLCLTFFEEPFFNSGKAGLVLACYKCINY